jgi:cell division septum initiation protein DivIVA
MSRNYEHKDYSILRLDNETMRDRIKELKDEIKKLKEELDEERKRLVQAEGQNDVVQK